MKEFIKKEGPYIKAKDTKIFYYVIQVLVIMIGYRILKDGFFPYVTNKITFAELFLPILLVFATVLLSYGCYYLGTHFLKQVEYSEEECLIDGMLLGLLLPIHTPIFIIVIAVFMTIIVGRYFYQGKPFFVPVLVGIMSAIGFSIWMTICNFWNYHTLELLFEYVELVNLKEVSLLAIWTGFIKPSITETSPILCFIAFIYLSFKKVIKWRVPIYFFGSLFFLLLISNFFIPTTLLEILKYISSSNLLFLSIFIGTDKRTTPLTSSGQILFASFLALFTYIGSYFLAPFLAMILSILFLNLLVPLFDYFGNYYQLKTCMKFENV